MKVILFVDLEGATGIDSSQRSWIRCGSKEWEVHGRDAITDDVCAVLKGCREAGVEEVFICDLHDQGNSIRQEKVHMIYPGCIVWSQLWDCPIPEDYDYAILVGLHAKTQSEGIIPHSFRFDIQKLEVNGKNVGEIEMFVGLLQTYQIKTILTVGDYHGVKEGEEVVPGMVGAVVKSKFGEVTQLLAREEANRVIIKKTLEALIKAEEIPTYELFQPPFQVNLHLTSTEYLPIIEKNQISGMWVEDGEVRWSSSSYQDFFAMFIQVVELINLALRQITQENQKFLQLVKEQYPDLEEKQNEIIIALKQRGIRKRFVLFTKEDRDNFMQVLAEVF